MDLFRRFLRGNKKTEKPTQYEIEPRPDWFDTLTPISYSKQCSDFYNALGEKFQYQTFEASYAAHLIDMQVGYPNGIVEIYFMEDPKFESDICSFARQYYGRCSSFDLDNGQTMVEVTFGRGLKEDAPDDREA